MKNIFTKHPNSIGESYFKHFLKAMSFGISLLLISFCVFIHAIFPFLFEHSTSEKIKKLSDKLEKRKLNKKD
tara:strand:+ start:121 stop:336 length:216 start_codon:yes stop_codon:yes gene_type:complete